MPPRPKSRSPKKTSPTNASHKHPSRNRTTKRVGGRLKSHSTNLIQKPPGPQSGEPGFGYNDNGERHTDAKSPPVSKHHRGGNAAAAIPDPVPDTTIHSSVPIILDYGAITSFQTSATTLGSGAPTQFSPLPALPSMEMIVLPTASDVVIHYPTESQVSNVQEHHPQPLGLKGHKLSAAIIVLLVAGASCFFLGLYILVRMYSRPNRSPRPTPSLPILNDPYADDKFSPPESPLFGGNERVSARYGSVCGPSAWTQYPRPKMDENGPSQNTVHSSDENTLVPGSDVGESRRNSVERTPQTPANSPKQAPLSHIQATLARAATRFSTSSISLYPNSPLPTTSPGVGLAIGGPLTRTAFTADGHPVLKRTKSRASLYRSRSDSLMQKAREQDAASHRYSQGLAYDGADVSSPSIATRIQAHPAHVIATPPTNSINGGRARIKSTYFAPGTYPRVSALPLPIGKHAPSGARDVHLPPTLQKSESRRDRDTEALAQALGLSSPLTDYNGSHSPQPTLYPDDSMSVVASHRPIKGSRTHKKTNSEAADRRSMLLPMTPTLDTSTLGSLMMMDYTTEKSVPQAPRSAIKKPQPPRNDKPPRVPSPPPLPSLTQMGLEHANPQAYADYRSPTYSIYGLYEHERKSRMRSGID